MQKAPVVNGAVSSNGPAGVSSRGPTTREVFDWDTSVPNLNSRTSPFPVVAVRQDSPPEIYQENLVASPRQGHDPGETSLKYNASSQTHLRAPTHGQTFSANFPSMDDDSPPPPSPRRTTVLRGISSILMVNPSGQDVTPTRVKVVPQVLKTGGDISEPGSPRRAPKSPKSLEAPASPAESTGTTRPAHKVGDKRQMNKKGPKMHPCDKCSKLFPRPSALKTHMNQHLDHRPYRCSQPNCPATFTVSSNARRHMKQLHGIGVPPRLPRLQSYGVSFEEPEVLDNQLLPSTQTQLRWVNSTSESRNL